MLRDGPNRYNYSRQAPLGWADPDGQTTAGGIAGARWGAGIGAAVGLETGPGDALAIALGTLAGAAIGDWWTGPDVFSSPSDNFIDCPTNKPEFRGVPGSTVRGGTGSRTYGPDGYPLIDRDWPHPDHASPGNGDHSHDWGRPADGSPPTNADRGPSRSPAPGDPPPPRGPNVPPP